MNIVYFDEEIKRFIDRLEMPTRAKVARTMGLLEQFGHVLKMPHAKHLGDGLHELRVRGGEEIRILYTFYVGSVVFLRVFKKSSFRIPPREMALARRNKASL